MAQYFTDFTEYTVGEQPSDWVKRFNPGDLSAIVRDVAGEVYLEWSKDADARTGLSWDALNADPDRADAEIIYLIRPIGSKFDAEAMCRASGSSSTDTSAYIAGTRTAGGTDRIFAAKYTSGTPGLLYNESQIYTRDVWHRVKVQVRGSEIRFKSWLEGGTEPAFIELTDTSLTAAGWLGLFGFELGTAHIGWVGIGTGPDDAPTGPLASTTPTLTAKITGITATSAVPVTDVEF